jgi:hypothetical protein
MVYFFPLPLLIWSPFCRAALHDQHRFESHGLKNISTRASTMDALIKIFIEVPSQPIRLILAYFEAILAL